MEEDITIFSDFVDNPSRITRDILSRILKLNNRYNNFFKRNFLSKLIETIKINLYLKSDFKDYYEYFIHYEVPRINEPQNISKLINEFERFYEKLLWNNLCLTYLYSSNYKNKQQASINVLTLEDEKILYMKKFYYGKISYSEFNRKFGHYGLNAYEISEKRFEEYSEKELKTIAKLAKDIAIKEKINIANYLPTIHEADMSVLIAIREIGKYKALRIIREIRREILRIRREKNIKNIFSKSLKELISLS